MTALRLNAATPRSCRRDYRTACFSMNPTKSPAILSVGIPSSRASPFTPGWARWRHGLSGLRRWRCHWRVLWALIRQWHAKRLKTARPIWHQAWSVNSRNCKGLWAAIMRVRQVWVMTSPMRFAIIISPWDLPIPCRRQSSEPVWPWPISWIP